MAFFYLIHSFTKKHINSHLRKTPASRSFIIHRKILILKTFVVFNKAFNEKGEADFLAVGVFVYFLFT